MPYAAPGGVQVGSPGTGPRSTEHGPPEHQTGPHTARHSTLRLLKYMLGALFPPTPAAALDDETRRDLDDERR